MSKLKTGFARVDITPALGTTLAGYYAVRHMEGILDPLYATAVVFDDSEKRAVLISVDHPLDEADETASLLILKRKDKEEIGIINFQVHPDIIGGTLASADYPKFVRDTYEKLIPNSRCMYINGAQ